MAYLIDRYKMNRMVDRVSLEISSVDGGQSHVLIVQRCGACTRVPGHVMTSQIDPKLKRGKLSP